MGLWTEEPSRRGLIAIGSIIALVVVIALYSLMNAAGDDPDPGLTPLQQVLREVNPDGTWSQETALRAFAAVFGPLPGVEIPDGPAAEVEFGTVALRMLSLYIDEISDEQREAALAAAGPLARFLTPEAATGSMPDPVRTMGIGNIDTILAADSDSYEAEIEAIVTSIESRIGRPLGIEFEVVVSPDPIGILHATAGATTDDGETITGCEITILPNAQVLSGKNLTAVLAHETWHCFEYSRLGTLSRKKSAPPWIIEGQAMWVGEALVGGSDGLEPADRHWKEYLLDPGPAVGLFSRSYDAIGFYSHLHDEGIDPWTVLDPILDQTSNLAAFDAAVGAQSLDVVTTWAPSWYRDGNPTTSFALVNAPGIPAASVRPAPAAFTISTGTFQQVAALDPLSAGLADVMVDTEILTIDVTGQGIVGDMVFGEEIVFMADTRAFCMLEDCTCPDGSPGPSDHLGDELRVAVTGDALSGSDALLRGWSVDEWCQQDDEPDEGDPLPPGSGGGSGTPCEGGCGSSNGDPHLTTIDGRGYDFQAAGEFVMLRSPQVEIQARQEPFLSSRSVTINTAVAVAVDGGRAAVYSDPSGLRLFVDGIETLPPATTGGLEITAATDGIQIAAMDGTTVYALGLGEWGVNLVVAPSPELRDLGEGLLSATGDGPLPALPDGTEVDFESDYRNALYADLADAWGVSPETTLFDYEPGSGPETFRDRSIPELEAPLDFFDLTQVLQETGLATCGSITDEALLIQCAFDVSVTADPGFVTSYESVDEFLTTEIVEEPGSMGGGNLSPLLEDIAVVSGSGLDDNGILYLSIRYEDQSHELVAIDPTAQTIVARTEIASAGPIALASGSVWMSSSTAGTCRVSRFDLELDLVGTVEVDCIFDILVPQLIAVGGAPWVHQAPELTRIDPATNRLDESVPLPFPNGYLRSTGETVFYSDLDEGIFRLLSGSDSFEDMGPGGAIAFPGGDGFWAEGVDTIVFRTGSGVPEATLPTDGTLVGATEDAALVERVVNGPELWAYPVDGSTPTLLASGPIIGTGSEQRTLDYFGNDPLIASPGLIVKIWVEHARSGDDAASLFVQAIPPR
jgi:hypothetical protein